MSEGFDADLPAMRAAARGLHADAETIEAAARTGSDALVGVDPLRIRRPHPRHRVPERRGMEGPPTEMTSSQDPTIKILVSGLDDWVSLAEARSLVQVAHDDLDDHALRAQTLAVVSRLLADGLVRPGTLSERFSAWDREDDAVRRIAEGWEDTDANGWLYSVWFENTEAGKAVARSIPDRG